MCLLLLLLGDQPSHRAPCDFLVTSGLHIVTYTSFSTLCSIFAILLWVTTLGKNAPHRLLETHCDDHMMHVFVVALPVIINLIKATWRLMTQARTVETEWRQRGAKPLHNVSLTLQKLTLSKCKTHPPFSSAWTDKSQGQHFRYMKTFMWGPQYFSFADMKNLR